MSINLLIDGNNAAIRVLTCIPGYNNQFKSSHQINLFIHSFLSSFLSLSKKIKEKYEIDNINIIWDSKVSLRKKIYPSYKVNRKTKTFEEEQDRKNHFSLLDQLKEELIKLGSWAWIEQEGFETDDLIAYLVKESTYDNQFIIYSSDNDFYQLLGDRIIQYLPHKKVFYTHLDFKNEFSNIIPEKYIYVKALAGDTGDNIKGIDQIGIKKATKLINEGQCWQYYVNKFPNVDLEMNVDLIRLPFKFGEGINIQLQKSCFNKDAWINLFQLFSLNKLNLFDFKNILE